jgi:hypothetical protein
MFFEDKRTAQERQRDLEMGDKMRAEKILAVNCLKSSIRPVLERAGVSIGLVGTGSYSGAELLLEIDGVTYSLSLRVNHDN